MSEEDEEESEHNQQAFEQICSGDKKNKYEYNQFMEKLQQKR